MHREDTRRSERTSGVGTEDNDAILCIGYSAHIRGRILRVDLSLSSLLGMHVRRPAIMRERARERRRPVERSDGRSGLSGTIQCAHIQAGRIYERRER